MVTATPLGNLIDAGREITSQAIRTPRAGLGASYQRTRAAATNAPAATPFSPGQFAGATPSFLGDLPQQMLSSLYAGGGVPEAGKGSMLGRFIEEIFRRGYGEDKDVLQAFEAVQRIESSIDSLDDQIARLNHTLNRQFPLKSEADPRSIWSEPAAKKTPKSSPIPAPGAPGQAPPAKPPRKPPVAPPGAPGPEEEPRKRRHHLLEAGKIVVRSGAIGADVLAQILEKQFGDPGYVKGIIAELVNREVISPTRKGRHRPLVSSFKELAGRLGAKGAIPGVIQGEGPSNAKAFTRMLRGVNVSPPPRRPPSVDEALGDDDGDDGEDLEFASDPTKPPPQPGSRAHRALRAAWDAVYRRRVQASERARAATRARRRRRKRALPTAPPRGVFVPPEQRGGKEEAIGAQVIRPEAPPVQESPEARRHRVLMEAELALRTPTAEKVRGLTIRDRYRRLKRSGMLLSRRAVGRKYGVERPSMGLVVEESERSEEERRQGRLQAREGRFGDYALRAQYGMKWAGSKLAGAGASMAGLFGARGLQQRLAGVAQQQAPGAFRQFAAGQAVKAAAGGGMATGPLAALFSPGGQLAMAAVALPAALWKAAEAGERFAMNALEASRGLEKWSGGIAKAMANLRRQDMLLERSMGKATTGSTVALAKAIEGMRNELQPIRENFRTLLNLTATIVAQAVRGGALAAKIDPGLNTAMRALNLLERWLSRNQDKSPLFFDQIREMTPGAPKNQPPQV